MADTYWITFCISPHGDEDGRYQALLAAVRRLTASMWWTESVNFLIFDSDHDIEHVAAEVARVIDGETDVALLAGCTAREARAIGAVQDPLLYELMPYARGIPSQAAPDRLSPGI